MIVLPDAIRFETSMGPVVFNTDVSRLRPGDDVYALFPWGTLTASRWKLVKLTKRTAEIRPVDEADPLRLNFNRGSEGFYGRRGHVLVTQQRGITPRLDRLGQRVNVGHWVETISGKTRLIASIDVDGYAKLHDEPSTVYVPHVARCLQPCGST